MRAEKGFTLLEVLVALALVATALGGTLAVLRQAIETQSYLERRLFAQWVAENVLNQIILDRDNQVESPPKGRETMLGRRYLYTVTTTPVPPVIDETASDLSAGEDDTSGLGLSTAAAAPAFDEVVVEVRDAPRLVTPLARVSRELRRATAP